VKPFVTFVVNVLKYHHKGHKGRHKGNTNYFVRFYAFILSKDTSLKKKCNPRENIFLSLTIWLN